MNTEKQTKYAVLIYMLFLLLLGGINFISEKNVLDLLYFIIVLYGIFKYLRYINGK